jgi:hypothetical protein
LPWPQADLADLPLYLNHPFHLSFGLSEEGIGYDGDTDLPAVFLLGRDGEIVAKNLHGEAIKAAVAEALAKAF